MTMPCSETMEQMLMRRKKGLKDLNLFTWKEYRRHSKITQVLLAGLCQLALLDRTQHS